MDLTLTVPDELAIRLRAVEAQLPEILELGLRNGSPALRAMLASAACSRRWLVSHRQRKPSA